MKLGFTFVGGSSEESVVFLLQFSELTSLCSLPVAFFSIFKASSVAWSGLSLFLRYNTLFSFVFLIKSPWPSLLRTRVIAFRAHLDDLG